MSSSIKETREEMDLLNRASITLDKTASGLIKSFATLSGENKKWTAASRLLSGTGLWSLQNRIRSIGAWLEIYFEGTKKAEQATNEYFDGLSELSDMLEKVGKNKEKVTETDEFKKMEKTLQLIYKEEEAWKATAMAQEMVQKRYDSQYEALKKAAEKEGKLLEKAMDRKERLEIHANKKNLKNALKHYKITQANRESEFNKDIKALKQQEEKLRKEGGLGRTAKGAELARLVKRRKAIKHDPDLVRKERKRR